MPPRPTRRARDADEGDALARDAADPFSALRDRFLMPVGPDGAPAIYLAGQSLGLQPRTARDAIEAELDAWARLGIDAHFAPGRPWFTFDAPLREPMARIVGARASEIAILNGLTVNIHLLLASFFRPSGRRRRILADGPLFPSDRHALTSHLAQRGLDPGTDLMVVGPRAGESTVSTDLEAAIGDHAPDLALVFLSGVNFATGQLLEIERLTAAGHAAGAIVGWDMASCGRQRRARAARLGHRLRGLVYLQVPQWRSWLGRRDFRARALRPGPVGAAAGRLVGYRSGSAIRDGRAVRARTRCRRLGGLQSTGAGPRATGRLAAILDEVGMPALRARSVALTGYLARLLESLPVEVITPADPAARGAQLSLRFDAAPELLARLAARGVVADLRAPDIIRVAPVPLYNTYHEAWRFAGLLREAIV